MPFKKGHTPWHKGTHGLKPSPPNKKARIIIKCACGCNQDMLNVKKDGTDRKYLHGHNKPRTGQFLSDFSRLKISKSKTGKPTSRKGKSIDWLKGEKNNRWKGGITTINEKERKSLAYKGWRREVFERDEYTCQKCKPKKSNTLVCHHIENFHSTPSKRVDINNGITLCKKCHEEFHSKYGNAENDVIQLMEFINPVIKIAS